jgi:hypothetical protein
MLKDEGSELEYEIVLTILDIKDTLGGHMLP